MSNSDNNPSTSSEPSLGDDGRSLWWAIPAAVASVLGVAGAVIARSRRAQPVRFPTSSERHETDASAPGVTTNTTSSAQEAPPVR